MSAREAGPPTEVDLSGTWLVHPAEGELHRRFADPDFCDQSWLAATVPGHWRSVEGLASCDGPVLYRRRFDAAPAPEGRRRFLVLDGVFYDADVWFDGAYLGATDGYFMPHAFELDGGGREHVVAVEVACPPQRDRTAKRLITGVFSHWDCLDPEWNPGGLWRPVRLVETGPVRIASLRVVCVEATEMRGRLRLDVVLDAAPPTEGGARTVRLRARLSGPGVSLDAERDDTVAPGENRLQWLLEVDRPPLWWPRRLGDQPLCELTVGAETDGERSDARHVRTGFREVRLDHWRFHLNGERLYVMGSNQGPARMALGEASPEEVRRDVALALEANLDMLRVHAHVSRPELYEAADDAGLLLWQDFPLQWGYARGIRAHAARQARAMVDLLGHHPSIVMWCAHNEPLAVDLEPGSGVRACTVVKVGATMMLPTWNKNLLDRTVRRAIQRADGTRPVDPHSGILPGPASGGTDSHLYFGWYHGQAADLGPALRRWPRLARFVSEFGAQAVPEHAGFMEPERWPDLDWERLGRRHACQKALFDRYVPASRYASFEEWRRATQEYQAALVQLQIEDLRRLKWRPNAGFLHFCFADGHQAVTWSVLDHERAPKVAYAALRDACRPVLPMLDPRTGDVHVASELRRPLAGAVVEVRAPGVLARWAGDVAADSVTYVGSVDPSALGRRGEVTVVLEHPATGPVEHRYGEALLEVAGTRRRR